MGQNNFVNKIPFLIFTGVVTAANSLIDALVKKNPEEYKGCVALAVSRLSRVRLFTIYNCVQGVK